MTSDTSSATSAGAAEPCVVNDGELLWFLGTLARTKLEGQQTNGRFAAWEGLLPRGAAPPLHSHPQDETFYVIDGQVTVWLVESDLDGGPNPDWVQTCARRCAAGSMAFAPGELPHTFRVESDTARMLFLSTPAGIEQYVRALGEPAQWPWLQPPSDGPRVSSERLAAVERALGIVRHGPPPPRI